MKVQRAAIYARVSTRDQDAETQVPLMLAWCERNGYSVAAEHQFIDVASGADPSRPLQRQLMAAAKGHHIHAVVCWRLDRWGRSTLDALHKVELLKDLGIEFHAIKEDLHLKEWDTDGRFRLELMQSLASRERNLIRDRTKEAFSKLEAQGWPNGKPGRPRADCAMCGSDRSEQTKPITGKHNGRRLPLCNDCKKESPCKFRSWCLACRPAEGTENGLSEVSGKNGQISGGLEKDRFQAPAAGASIRGEA